MNYKDKFVGISIYGFCNGYFGSSSYEDKIIIASGENWIVGKSEDKNIYLATFDNNEDMEVCIREWSIEAEDNW